MSVALTAAAQTEGMQKRQGKGKTNPAGWFSMSALGAQGNCARCGERFELVFVDSGFGRNQEGISPVATGDSGRCPENPQAF
ncbi:hypothetical protein [Butyricicoccus pullicaecorum]|nr:hypothetical protein [Butyricicoccus pullicaecorum]